MARDYSEGNSLEGNVLQRLEDIERVQSQLQARSVQVTALSQLSPNLGLVEQGGFIAGQGSPYAGDLVGVAMLAEPVIASDGHKYNLVGMNNGGLMFGISAEDGSAVFLGGGASINEQGIVVDALADALIQRMIVGSEERQGYLGAMFLDGEVLPGWGLRFQKPATASELLTNANFDSGLSSWTLDSGITWLSAYQGHSGVAAFKPTVAGTPYQMSQSVSVTPGTTYVFSVLATTQYPGQGFARLEWYDVSSVLLRTDILTDRLGGSWQTKIAAFVAPASASTAKIVVGVAMVVLEYYNVLWVDAVSFKLSNAYNHLVFHPDTGRLITRTETGMIAGVGMGPARIRNIPYTLFKSVISGAGLPDGTYYYKAAWFDDYGETQPTAATSAAVVASPNSRVQFGFSNPAATVTTGFPSQARGIRFYRSTDNVNFYFIFDHTTNLSNPVDTGYTADTTRTPSPTNTTGSRPVCPTRAVIFGDELSTPIASGIVFQSQQPYGFYFEISAANANDGDELGCSFMLAAGVYTCNVLGVRNVNHGKFDYLLDGVVIKSAQDWYNSTLVYNQVMSFDFTCEESGHHHLLIRVNGKNASATDYCTRITKISIVPSASNSPRVME